MFQVAYAIKDGGKGQEVSGKTKEPKPEEKLQKALDEIDGILNDTATDTDTKKKKLKTKKSEIGNIDVEIKKQFKETEDKIKDLPDEIKQRHKDFVKHYDENLKELNTNLDAIDKAKTEVEINAHIENAKAFLEKVKPPKKHTPLDPNNLPHQIINIIEPERKTILSKNESSKFSSLLQSLGNLLVPSVYAEEPPPTDPNLSETIEISLTPEVQSLANELGGTPTDLYEYVRNVYRYEPYAGSVKGALQTLHEKAGNEWDIASLLISLYRSVGIPARYAVGTIEMPIERAMDWLGVEDPNMAGTMLSSNGRPTSLITSGGKITALETQHVWVQAYIPFLPSRGTATGPGDTWVDIDPSFKAHTIEQALTLTGEPIFDQANYLSTFHTESPYEYYHAQLQDFLNTNAAGYRPEALMREQEIVKESFGVLVGLLPYKVVSVPATYSEIPDSFRQKLTISITDPYTGMNKLSYIAPLPQIIGKRLTLSYIPATVTDQTVIEHYGDVFSTPPYLIKLKPVLKLEGVTVVEGSSVGAGENQSLLFVFKTPIGTSRVSNIIIAGEYYAIGLNSQTSDEREQLLERTKELEGVSDTIKFNDPSTLDDRLGEILYLSAMVYHQNLDSEIHKISSLHKVIDIRQVSEMMYFLDVKVDYVFGSPLKITPTGITADMDRDIHLVIPVDGDVNRIKPYMQLVGNLSSFLEHAVTEGIYQTEAISAVKAIQLVHDQGIPVHTITSQNINTELPMLQISEQVKTDIRNATNAGKEVIVPERNLTLHDWSGVGYIIQDPLRGQGAYMISGGLGGAAIVASYFFKLIDTTMSVFVSNASASTSQKKVCFLGLDNYPGTKDDVCYTVVEIRDIDPGDCSDAGGCDAKYGFANGEYAEHLIDTQEHDPGIHLTQEIQAYEWKSQDGARYMRVGPGISHTIEILMAAMGAVEHNISTPSGSGYRTKSRNTQKKFAPKSHHVDGVAADIKLSTREDSENDADLIEKCLVLQAADALIKQPFGEVLAEQDWKKTVHLATPASTGRDYGKKAWRCK